MKNMLKAFTGAVLPALLAINLCNAQGYRIQVQVEGLPNDTLLLGYHFGDRKFIKDTAVLDEKGRGEFADPKPLAGGIYLVVLPDKNYIEVLIDGNQFFSLNTRLEDPVKHLVFSGSPQNTAFLAYQKSMIGFQQRSAEISEKKRKWPAGSDSASYYQQQLEGLNTEVRNYWESVIAKDPGAFLSKIILAMKPLDVPDFNIPSGEANPDSMQMVLGYGFQRDHFFDGFDFADSSLLRTPLLHNKLQYYFTRLLIQHPDSLTGPVDTIIGRAKAHPSVFQYITVFLLNHFMQSNIMGHDAVYVHIAEKYYLSGEAFWAEKDFLDKLDENVGKIRPNLIGVKGHDLVMESLSGEWKSLHQVRAEYTILYFYEPDCGFCKTVTPKLFEIYEKMKDRGVEVFAVYTQDDRKEWQDYLEKNHFDWINVYDPHNRSGFRYFYNIISTPALFLLDRDKKIVAKRIPVESLEPMLERLFTAGSI